MPLLRCQFVALRHRQLQTPAHESEGRSTQMPPVRGRNTVSTNTVSTEEAGAICWRRPVRPVTHSQRVARTHKAVRRKG